MREEIISRIKYRKEVFKEIIEHMKLLEGVNKCAKHVNQLIFLEGVNDIMIEGNHNQDIASNEVKNFYTVL